ncbi:MAG TPA: DUF6491 family protein [Pseudomonadota bacterium]|nr:hypothetical protein [Xanthomonadales bacterium]HQX24976.1 DUF6491 family protein [Pseudomonadota bacterium]MBP6692843.1 hypothetical protein [Xanthomonadales bacterium]MBP7418468.1 hypothetical protein [Xanthomonadales bacterium]HQY36289.1 DUF6491 family protein [Pseudomonadota bacterium]
MIRIPKLIPLLAVALLLVACATDGPTSSERDAARIAELRAAAGDPVRGIRFSGMVVSWTAVGDTVVAVWTRPREAWLFELVGRCPGLRSALSLSFTSQAGRVTAGFDRIVVRSRGPSPVSSDAGCRIREIRPLSLATLRGGETSPTADPPDTTGIETDEAADPGAR